MSDWFHLLAPFSLNWSRALEGTARATGGRVSRRCEFVACDVRRPAGLMNSVVLLAAMRVAPVGSVMAALDTLFASETARQAGAVFMFTVWPAPDLTPFGWTCVD